MKIVPAYETSSGDLTKSLEEAVTLEQFDELTHLLYREANVYAGTNTQELFEFLRDYLPQINEIFTKDRFVDLRESGIRRETK